MRVARGTYEICEPFRRESESLEHQVAESAADYAASGPAERTSIHAVVFESEGQFVAECLEVGVVTQGRSLDETLSHLAKRWRSTWRVKISRGWVFRRLRAWC